MGTTYSITLINPPKGLVQVQLQQLVDQRLKSINQVMSTYIDDSEIMNFNRGPVNEWIKVSPQLFEVVELSQHISVLSSGQFDITVGPLVELWGFGKNSRSQIPSDEKILSAMALVGWQNLTLSQENKSLNKAVALNIDLSAVAKGYAVDQLTELLSERNVQNFLVEIGGEMKVQGLNRKQEPWRIGIEIPSLIQKRAQQLVLLSNQAIATSGDYRNFFEEEGVRYSHTINPVTGRPVKHNIASVTVVAETAAQADALSTALNIMGEEDAMALAESKNLAAYFILYDNRSEAQYRIEYTKAFQALLPPTHSM